VDAVVKRREILKLPLAFASPMQAATPPIQYRNDPPYARYTGMIASGADEFGPDPPMPPKPPAPTGWRFADITGSVLDDEQLSRGIPYWLARLDPASGIDIFGNNGIAAGDIDNDGVDEIYVCQPGGLPNKLLKWSGGRFIDLSKQSGADLLDDTSCALFLDVRNRGIQDLVVLRSNGPVLFHNDGNGRFTPQPGAFRFANEPQGGFTGMAAADYDRDGRVDIYMCCYSFFQSEAQFRYPVPYFDARNGPPNFLFRNTGAHFEDVTAQAGLNQNNDRYSFAPAWADFDGSGFPSLYVANDFGRNNLYKNEGGRFRDVAAEAGVEDIGPGMSACWFDGSGTGRPDLYVANMWTAAGQAVVKHSAFPHPLNEAWRGHTKGNSYYRNAGNGKFTSEAGVLGVEMGRWGWSADAADFDNDGRAELLLTCGMMTGDKQPDLMGFFWRQVVAKTPKEARADEAYENGWNAINQFIREGYSWNGGEPNVFYVRDGAKYRDVSQESGVNFADDARAFAVTELTGDGCLDVLLKNRLGPQLRVLRNRCGQSRPRIAFRLRGVKSNRDAIGARVTVDGQTKWVTAGSGYLSQHTKTLYFGAAVAKRVTVVWPSGLVQECGELLPGRLYEIQEGEAAVASRVFKEASPIPARAPATENTPRLHDTWFDDPVPLPETQDGPGLFVVTETNPKLAAYSLFRRYLFEYRAPLETPMALLLNADGHAVKIYAKTPDKATVERDLRERRQPKGTRDFFKLGASLLWCGYPEEALPYLEATLVRQPDNVRTLVLAAQVHREAGRFDNASVYLDRALATDPKSAEAWNEAGGVALARGQYEQALGAFEQALRSKTGALYALLNAGQAADKLDRPALAEHYHREALRADPASAEAAQGLGLALAKQKRYTEAEKHLLDAVRRKPALSGAWNNLGVLYASKGKTAEAADALRSGIKAAPRDEQLYLNLARIYVRAGRVDEAKAVLRELPESRIARQALAELEKQ
jgi:tetratricopeptide (TPR) repeat protein